MGMKRIIAQSMRDALRIVREEMGPEAVIVNSIPHAKGVEVIASTDTLTERDNVFIDGSKKDVVAFPNEMHDESTKVLLAATQKRSQINRSVTKTNSVEMEVIESPAVKQEIAVEREKQKKETAAEYQHDFCLLTEVRNEIQTMRDFLGAQISGLAWQEFKRMNPQQVSVLRRLIEYGMDAQVALGILQLLDNEQKIESAWNLCVEIILARITRAPIDMNRKLCLAFIGQNGSGKTTVIGKIAFQYRLNKPGANILIISSKADGISPNYYAKGIAELVGANFSVINNSYELEKVLENNKGMDLILFDTPGFENGQVNFPWVGTSITPDVHLVLESNLQFSTLENILDLSKGIPIAGIIATKLDRAPKRGGIASILLKGNLPISGVSEEATLSSEIILPEEQDFIQYFFPRNTAYREHEYAWLTEVGV